MIQSRNICMVIILIVAATTMQISTDSQPYEPIVQDVRNNITAAQYNQIIKSIQTAQQTFNGTAYKDIARYVFANAGDGLVTWNVYVYEGRIRQIGIGPGANRWDKYMWLTNYGKYNLTYVFIGINAFLCLGTNQVNGDYNTTLQFGKAISDSDRLNIFSAIENAIVEQGNVIMNNAESIEQALRSHDRNAWTIVIADPSARYGYMNCMTGPGRWFGLKAYKNFKWNYFGSVRVS